MNKYIYVYGGVNPIEHLWGRARDDNGEDSQLLVGRKEHVA